MKRVLFITKPFIIEPLGIGNLSATLKKDGYKVDLIQTGNNVNDTIKEVIEFNPDFLCYSIWTGGHCYFFKLNQQIKDALRKRIISIFGGPHCTFYNNIILSEGVDYLVKGEADTALPFLLKQINDNYRPPSVISTTLAPQNLDDLPLTDRVPLYKYKHNKENPIRNLMTSRGCPYSCTYCYNEKFNEMFEGSKVRLRNMNMVIEEAVKIKKDYPATGYFFFNDDELGGRKDRLRILASDWKQKVNLPFHVQMRIENIDSDSIQMLKSSGCDSLTFAIESGSYKTRKNILNKKFTNELILDKVKILHQNKMRFRVENMIGIPC